MMRVMEQHQVPQRYGSEKLRCYLATNTSVPGGDGLAIVWAVPPSRTWQPLAPMGSNKTNIRQLGHEPRNEPRAGRARWRVGAMDRVQSNEPILVLGQIELNEPSFSQILAHHRFGHVAPTNAVLQQHVLGGEVP